MEVLGFQIFFFLLILISGIFGRKARNGIIIFSIIFTLIMVFMSWLIILQLFTIAFAYFISENYVGNSSEKLNKVDDKYGKGCISFIVIFGLSAIVLKIFHENYFKNQPVESQKTEISDSSNYNIESSPTINYTPKNYESNIDSIENNFKEQEVVNKYNYVDNSESNQKEIIQYFIMSENERDITKMNNYLSNDINKFWKDANPTIQQVNEIYYKTWRNFEYTNTEIIEIDCINYNTYKVKVNYEYGYKFRQSSTIFEFDETNKIIAIY